MDDGGMIIALLSWFVMWILLRDCLFEDQDGGTGYHVMRTPKQTDEQRLALQEARLARELSPMVVDIRPLKSASVRRKLVFPSSPDR